MEYNINEKIYESVKAVESGRCTDCVFRSGKNCFLLEDSNKKNMSNDPATEEYKALENCHKNDVIYKFSHHLKFSRKRLKL